MKAPEVLFDLLDNGCLPGTRSTPNPDDVGRYLWSSLYLVQNRSATNDNASRT